jgi:hypothetical protein
VHAISSFAGQPKKTHLIHAADANRSALAAYIRAGIDGPRKQRRVFQNRLQECFPCGASIAARRQQVRLIEKFARENSWSTTIHDMGLSVTFQGIRAKAKPLRM